MKIKSIKLNRFKRFADLTITDISADVKLVVLAGPNGCGKSSLFDAILSWHRMSWAGLGHNWAQDYHVKQDKQGDIGWNNAMQLEFHPPLPNDQNGKRKAVYLRTAYRNDPDFTLNNVQRVGSAVDETRMQRFIDNDRTVSANYQRLISHGLEDVFENEPESTTIGEFRKKTIGEIQDVMLRLFGDLVLNSLGNPLTEGTFRFDKGASRAFSYKNLSGGEKAAFDLLLDIIIKKREFDDTVFCIDEPEAHMSTKLQGALLDELCNLIPDKSQLWVATHSIGMMRKARDLASENPGSVAFIDMSKKDFDQPQILKPIVPNRAFWHRVLNVALDDLSELVAPSCVVICEGRPVGTKGSERKAAIDAKCYDLIFGNEYPDVRFLSAGNCHDVENDKIALMEAIKSLISGTNVIRLIDHDDRSPEEISELENDGVRVLSLRQLEGYLFDDEVLRALCNKHEKPNELTNIIADKTVAIANSVQRGNPKDDIKSASGEIYNAIKNRLGLSGGGSDARAFMLSQLAPLITTDMAIYRRLREDIFGE